jgi:hypothetical protein
MGGNTSLTGRAGFIALAVRILSILPNSAGPERVFSEFGMIHTKRGNRLDPEKVHKTSLLRSDCMKTHAANGLIPKRKVCQYSITEDQLDAEIEGPGNDDEGDSSNSPSTL